MEHEFEKKNLELLEQHFQDGCKWHCVQKLGVEVEHFVVDRRTGQSVPYYGPDGIGAILAELREQFPGAYCEKDRLLGLYNADYSISLEPAAQLEISIAPWDSVRLIGQIYENFRRQVEPLLAKRGYALVNLGYQPRSRVDDLPMIPKKRYGYMDEYFQKSGRYGRNMMRGTASTQVSIDYCCEGDFLEKYRAAYLAMPALKLLSDNTPVFEGEPYRGHLMRTRIWDDVDAGRCGILPGIFRENFGFGAYAEYLWNLQPIYIPVPGGTVYTGTQRVRDIWSDRFLTAGDVEHVQSMTFLDVRVKNYVEIRGADSLPLPYMKAYTALVKGLTFTEEARQKLLALPAEEREIREAERSLIADGYRGRIYGTPADEFCLMLLELAAEHLEPAEAALLTPFTRLAESGTTLAEQQRERLWPESAERFGGF